MNESRVGANNVVQPLSRRWLEGLLFVAVWMVLGLTLRLDANSYLLLGIPLTLIFQLAVRREPLLSLWVRDSPPPRKGWTIPALGLAVLPAFVMIDALSRRQWVVGGWMASAVAGAFAAGYALSHFKRNSVRPFMLCLLTAGLAGVVIMVLARVASGNVLPPEPLIGLRDFALYFAVCFILEEVSFRGALDSHLHRAGDHLPVASALLGAALWGLWHLPVVAAAERGLQTALSLIAVHSLIGVPLAVYWRRSGNLVVPVFSHALVDAVRNALRIAG